MATVDLKIEGVAELQEKLFSIAGAVAGQKALIAAARIAMRPVLEAARQNAPRDTGVLADSIYLASARPTANGSIVASAGLRVKKSAHYRSLVKGARKRHIKGLGKSSKQHLKRTSAHWRWHFVELGTSKMRARPFLRPALEANKDKVLDRLKTELRRQVNLAAKRKSRNAGSSLPPTGGE